MRHSRARPPRQARYKMQCVLSSVRWQRQLAEAEACRRCVCTELKQAVSLFKRAQAGRREGQRGTEGRWPVCAVVQREKGLPFCVAHRVVRRVPTLQV